MALLWKPFLLHCLRVIPRAWALRCCHVLDEHPLAWTEQPAREDDEASHAAIARALLAHDMSVTNGDREDDAAAALPLVMAHE
jgi:L-alanine-DL-glutamate epimerase-like enolase superfamily enzyme